MAAGNFTDVELLKVQLKANEMWADGMQNSELIPRADAAIAVLTHQNARFRELDNPEKDRTIGVSFIKSCDLTVTDGTNNCSITEPELEAAEQIYAFDTWKKTGFSINRAILRKSILTREELAARGLLQCRKNLDEFWAQRVLVKLKGFASRNGYPAPFAFDAARNTTVVPNALYGTPGQYGGFQLPVIFLKQSIQNRMNAPYFIDNGRMFLDYMNAQLNNGNTDANSAGGKKRADMIDLTQDLVNFGKAGITNATTFEINRNAVAMKTYNRHKATPETIQGNNIYQIRYTVPSLVLPGVDYDVFYTVDCVYNNTTGETELHDTWRLETRGGIWKNPESCPITIGGTTYQQSGVISYTAADEIV